MSLRPRLERRLIALWFDRPTPPWWAWPLCLLSVATRSVAKRRRDRIAQARQARHAHAKRPRIVVVGNLIVGGSGKTPICMALAQGLRDRGWRAGLLARGDGAHAPIDPPRRIDPARPDAHRDGDEATLLALRSGLPVYAGRRRGEALRMLLQDHPGVSVVISDDGLQHEALPRDIELAVFDRRGLGNGCLLPAGPLREPAAAAASFDALILNLGMDESTAPPPLAHHRWFSSRLRPSAIQSLASWRRTREHERPEPGSRHRGGASLIAADPAQGPEADRMHAIGAAAAELRSRLGDRPCAAVAGIAQPEAFFALLRGLGLSVAGLRPGDHGAPGPAWWAAIDAPIIMMTEKDAVKCPLEDDGRLFVVSVRALPDPALLDWLEEELRGPTPA